MSRQGPPDIAPRWTLKPRGLLAAPAQPPSLLPLSPLSVNIKERLDFSCALFSPDGALVANAPHLPVHLGAMSEAVRFQVHYYTRGPGREEGLHEGDVLMSNHPQLAGGSHLPDITVITPVYK